MNCFACNARVKVQDKKLSEVQFDEERINMRKQKIDILNGIVENIIV